MSDKTVINPAIGENPTVLNPNAQPDNATVLNAEIGGAGSISSGTLLGGKYKLSEKLKVRSGEADLYLCSYNNTDFIAKIYRRESAIKPEVINILKELDSPYVSKLYDTGVINGMTYEILPYYKNGSVQGKTFSAEQLKKNIIPCINEGLRVLHEKGIIHKDLKPSNIMLCDNGKDVAIIDFGISSVREEERDYIKTETGRTPQYAAPESALNYFLADSDYYSFGITVFELFCGKTPLDIFSNKKEKDELVVFINLYGIPIPIPEDMPSDLADLIRGLTYREIALPDDRSNPNKRWTYSEVRNWCSGKKQIVPGTTGSLAQSYNFNNKEFKDIHALMVEFASNWEKGKSDLFGNYLSIHFKNVSDQNSARICDAAVNDAQSGKIGKDLALWTVIYSLAPHIRAFYWKNKKYEKLSDLGCEMLEKLRRNDTSDFAFYDSILKEKLLSAYVAAVLKNSKELTEAAKNVEAMHAHNGTAEEKKTYYTMAYMLSGKKDLMIDGKVFNSVDELAEYIKKLIADSYEDFDKLCHKLVDDNGNLDSQFECWLYAIGKKDKLNQWRNSLRK